jgi:tRNA(Ile)-lysidine synthase
MPDSVEYAFLEALAGRAGVKSGDRLMVAFSGGTDSSVLLSLFSVFQSQLGIRIAACHVNHHLRGPESERDAEFCRARAGELAVPFVLKEAEVAPIAQERGLSVEHAAREVRYELLSEAASEAECNLVATAHHRDDRAETFLFRLLRGTGPKGLMSIPWRRGNLVRPLLAVPREDLERYARERNIPSVHDSSNENTVYSRNFLRREVFPLLESRFPGASGRIAALCDLFTDEDDLAELAMQPFRVLALNAEDGSPALSISAFGGSVPPAALARLVREACEASGTMDFPGRPLMDALRCASSGGEGNSGVYRSGSLSVTREYGLFTFRQEMEKFPFSQEYVILKNPVSVFVGGCYFHLRIGIRGFRTGNDACAFRTEGTSGLRFRSWLPGDRIALAGGGKRKLQDLFTDRKLPASLRKRAVVIAPDNGDCLAAFYVPGQGFRVSADRYVSGESGEDCWSIFAGEASGGNA